MAATHRAVYQGLEHGHIFSDPLAVAMLGVDREHAERQSLETPSSRRMRLFIALRNRFAEGTLTDAWQRGVRQMLVLGAGLDTYSYRRDKADALRVFEVDRREATRPEASGARDPLAITYVPVDFEEPDCGQVLAAAGFNPDDRTLVIWLGVVPYLTEDAFWSALKFFAALPGGAELVFDYSNPPQRLAPERHRDEDQTVVAGNPEHHGLCHFDTAELHDRLRTAGFIQVDDLGPVDIAQRYLPEVTAPVAGTGSHIVHIATA
ncbi:MAG TPA: SAM-dependent methyltransferase [Steroidobacteraceae bacterium]|jgi:methyltransferase (TIGR00027 family)|nr:SAM-dependent methyltransferase [Steroidobacteraceae bacterium]